MEYRTNENGQSLNWNTRNLVRDAGFAAGAIQGDDGKDAYQLAVASGFVGTLAQWLASLEGKNGETPELRVTGRIIQYRFATQNPTTWTDLFEFPEPSYTHTQNIAASVWVIPHNLSEQFVSVKVIDFSGTILIPEEDYTSQDVVTLTFGSPKQGIAKITK